MWSKFQFLPICYSKNTSEYTEIPTPKKIFRDLSVEMRNDFYTDFLLTNTREKTWFSKPIFSGTITLLDGSFYVLPLGFFAPIWRNTTLRVTNTFFETLTVQNCFHTIVRWLQSRIKPSHQKNYEKIHVMLGFSKFST